jgi:hypothetical protein
LGDESPLRRAYIVACREVGSARKKQRRVAWIDSAVTETEMSDNPMLLYAGFGRGIAYLSAVVGSIR